MTRQNAIRIFAGLLLALLLGFFVLRLLEHSLIYYPARALDATGAQLGRPFEDVLLKASDGVELNGWFFPADTNSPRARMVVLVCHGNAGNISHRLGLCQALLTTGINVFLFDYRGYGRSQGRPSEEGTYRDAQAAYQWLRAKSFAGTNILAFGESLGGAVATELARREPLGGLILQSSFSSLKDLGAELYPWLPVRWLSTVEYDTCGKLPGINVPVLVMHSRSDELVGFHHGQKLFRAANQPKLLWELEGGHNDALDDHQHFTAGIEKFLQMVEAARAKPAGTAQ